MLPTTNDPAERRPTIDVDAVVDPSALDTNTVEEFYPLRPFGTGHDEAIVIMESVEIVDEEWFGDDRHHWKGHLAKRDGVTNIDWNGETRQAMDGVPSSCDVEGTLAIDSYSKTVQINSSAIQTVDGQHH